jgi:hypothetical protein
MKTMYFTPEGKQTSSLNVYLKSWRSLYIPVCKALECEVIAFDPAILVMRKGGRGASISLPTDIAQKIKNLYLNQK